MKNNIEIDQLGLIDCKAAAQLLGLTDRTLRRWRQQRTGPKCVFVGRSVKYRLSEINDWATRTQGYTRESHSRPARPSSKKKGE
ncbi:helix-turn-helix transcriptional regulator [Elstera cyanobacteriorum]|uniref:helix-turn-helix transcriptional regulator n=1 Tax=Elstera cyanobacteriorum TaxID=2022747 RepID=UPI0023531D18|nr:helix-turn-helix domain-containing protein [Elstera cyanobacteriorum]MCK6443329.1 helix-turn-helix domain-containing protein [Elstera cyanobacteriorum]